MLCWLLLKWSAFIYVCDIEMFHMPMQFIVIIIRLNIQYMILVLWYCIRLHVSSLTPNHSIKPLEMEEARMMFTSCYYYRSSPAHF